MPKYTYEEFQKLTPEEKREALLRFENPSNLYRKEKFEKINIDKD